MEGGCEWNLSRAARFYCIYKTDLLFFCGWDEGVGGGLKNGEFLRTS